MDRGVWQTSPCSWKELDTIERLIHIMGYACMCMLSRFSHVRLLETLWPIAHQAPLSIGFPRQEY